MWGRNALRFSDAQLSCADVDGFGESWPLAYQDLQEWYDKVESFLGVQGSRAGIESIPDGIFAGPHPITAAEEQVLATLADKWPDRPGTTCRIISYDTQRVPLPLLAAQSTGLLRLQSDAVVSHITTDPDIGKARGVVFIDRNNGLRQEVSAKVVVLCASTIESVRVMLNSTPQWCWQFIR